MRTFSLSTFTSTIFSPKKASYIQQPIFPRGWLGGFRNMGSFERSKKKVQLWTKTIVHFSLCFIMGFFTGFAPTGKNLLFSSQVAAPDRPEFAPRSMQISGQVTNVNRSLSTEVPMANPTISIESKTSTQFGDEEAKSKLRRLVIIITPTSTRLQFQAVLLRRLANTIRLVPQPLLWVVVEGQTDSSEVSEILRKTGIMYRHLVSKENFTDVEAELSYQRNLALKHIEHHRLSGIVHFAGLNNVYDLGFFNQLRDIGLFGTWPLALLSANRKKVMIEGPVCDSSKVIGWHLKKINNDTDAGPFLHVSSFAFNSSILWDPERWGRTSAAQDTSQDSINFVKQVILEDETNIKGTPGVDCSGVMLWRLNLQAANTPSK